MLGPVLVINMMLGTLFSIFLSKLLSKLKSKKSKFAAISAYILLLYTGLIFIFSYAEDSKTGIVGYTQAEKVLIVFIFILLIAYIYFVIRKLVFGSSNKEMRDKDGNLIIGTDKRE